MNLTVAEIGEQGLLQRIQAFCPADVIGDDAAVLSPAPGTSLVVTTDVLVDGVHFSDQTTPPDAVGWRAVAANLSDLAAMGATPLGITVGLALPGDLSVAWIEALYRGMTACLQPYQTAIVGGDVVRSPICSISITALGQVPPHQVITRSAAQVGDAIVVTGYHGDSRAGLELLLGDGALLGAGDREQLCRAHQYPVPRLDVLPFLQALMPDPDWRIAGMDSSDGLADAILQICRASRVGATIQPQNIPISPELRGFVAAEQALEWALYGGEDFELVLCLPPQTAASFVKQLGGGAAIVGEITATPEVWLAAGLEPAEPIQLRLEKGFQHFQG